MYRVYANKNKQKPEPKLTEEETLIPIMKAYFLVSKLKTKLVQENPNVDKKLYKIKLLNSTLEPYLKMPFDVNSNEFQTKFSKAVIENLKLNITLKDFENEQKTLESVFTEIIRTKLEERILNFREDTKRKKLMEDLNSVDNFLISLTLLEHMLISYVALTKIKKFDLISSKGYKYILPPRLNMISKISNDISGVIYAMINTNMLQEFGSNTKLINLYILRLDNALSHFQFPRFDNYFKRFYTKDLIIEKDKNLCNKILTLTKTQLVELGKVKKF